MDNQVRVVTYQLTAPANVSGPVFLSGTASFDGQSVPITGLSTLPLEPPPSGTVARQLPDTYRAGQTITVTLRATPEAGISLYGVEETIPSGWTPLNLGGGSLTTPGVIKWGPFVEATPQVLSYTLTAPAGAMSNVVFRGTGWFDSTTVITSGDATMAPAPPGGGSVARTLPAHYESGQSVAVSLWVQPDLGTEAYAVLESPPTGWRATNINNFGSVSADGRTVRWGPFLDADARTLTYELVPPATARSNVVFSGTGQFNEVSLTTVGQVSLPWVSQESGTVTRMLSATCQPGRTISITNLVAPNEAVTTYALEEWVPSGWTVTNVGGGTYQAASHSVRWGPIFDNSTNVIVWQVTAPTNAVGSVTFTGTAWFGAVVLPIGGASHLTVLPPSQGTVRRSLPGYFQPGVAFTVTNALAPESNVVFCVVEETVPNGWQVQPNISHGGFFLPDLSRLRWGPFTDAQARTLTFTLLPPISARGSVAFSGLASFDEAQTTILGATNLVANSPPTFSAIPDLVAGSDKPLPLTFTLTDDETPSDQLQVSVASSNESLLPSQNLALGGIGATRSLTVSPQPDQEGQSTITLTASDGTFTRKQSFVLTLLVPPRLTQEPTNQLAQLGATVQFTAAASGSAPRSYQWQRDSVAVAGGGGATLTLNNVQTNQVGFYRVVVANDVGVVTSAVARLTVNSPPVTGLFSLSTYRNVAKTFLAVKLTRTAQDPDDDSILLTAVSPSSTGGGTVQLAAGQVTYTPPSGYIGAEAFTYTLSDDQGGTATGTVSVVVEAGGVLALDIFRPVVVNDNFTVGFAGVPGRTYTIERLVLPSPTWQKVTNLIAPSQGVFQFGESSIGATGIWFYRMVYPAY